MNVYVGSNCCILMDWGEMIGLPFCWISVMGGKGMVAPGCRLSPQWW